MRRQSVVSARAPSQGATQSSSLPVVTLTAPSVAGKEDTSLRSASAQSSQDGDGASTLAGTSVVGAMLGTAGDNDFRDTVLYMVQQQSMQHRELMEVVQKLAFQVDTLSTTGPIRNNSRNMAATNGVAAAGSPQLSAAPLGWQSGDAVPSDADAGEFVSSHEHDVKRFLEYGKAVTDPTAIRDSRWLLAQQDAAARRYTATQGSWFQNVPAVEIELHAAKARIAQLESANRLLQQQLEQREETIQRLTSANISSLTQRIGGSLVLSPREGAAASGQSGQPTASSSVVLSQRTPPSVLRPGSKPEHSPTRMAASLSPIPSSSRSAEKNSAIFSGSAMKSPLQTSPALTSLLQKYNSNKAV